MKLGLHHWTQRAVCISQVVSFLSLGASAQPLRPQESGGRSQFLFYEAVNLLADDPANSRIDVLYRINTDFFVAVKNAEASFPWGFQRRGEIQIELLDSTDVSCARAISRFKLGANTTDQEPGHIVWHQGADSFSVRPGTYRLVLEVTDLESERRFFDRSRMVRANDFTRSGLQLSTPLFVALDSSTAFPGRVVPQNFGGNLPFRGRTAMLLEVASTGDSGVDFRVEYSLAALRGRGEPPETSTGDTLLQPQMLSGPVVTLAATDSAIAYSVNSGGGAHTSALLIPLKTNELPLRPLELRVTVRRADEVATITKPVLMVWPEMPASLRDVDRALQAIRYITTERELDSLTRGSYEERRANLEGFWKSKGRPGTVDYRELMGAYYLRVDRAEKEFATLHEPDGSKTDRGRTFILHGSPTRVERTLSPTSGFQEVWSYEMPAKKFVFVDKGKSGDYVLISSGSL